MKKKLFNIFVLTPTLLLLGVATYLHINQESIIFKSESLPDDHTFSFSHPHTEHVFDMPDGAYLHAAHFKTEDPKGVVLYLHGRGGNIQSKWNDIAPHFITHGYDVLLPDYRSFGKSKGPLSQKALLDDAHFLYSHLKESYPEENIIVYGRSLGSGLATHLASKHRPQALILESPYYSLYDLAPSQKPYIPSWVITSVLRYPMRSDKWIQSVNVPIHIFHGTGDTLIPHHSSKRLSSQILHKSFTTHFLEGTEHDDVDKDPLYHEMLKQILNKNLSIYNLDL